VRVNKLGTNLVFAATSSVLLFAGSTVPSLAKVNKHSSQAGVASVYSTESGSRTSTGGRLNPGALTAAHRSLPFGTKVRVTNKKNGRSVVVTINDRGPFVRGRVIDLTPAGARALGFSGLAPVNLQVVS
jgi:rare lipoprotein A